MRRPWWNRAVAIRRGLQVSLAIVLIALTAGCSSSSTPAPTVNSAVSSGTNSTITTSPRPSTSTTSNGADPSTSPNPTSVVEPAARPGLPAAGAPIIVVDPGHSPSIQSIDPSTGLDDSDYENEPEMHDVFAVAELVKARLEADGYRVVMTKNSATQRISLGQRAAVANNAHAALAVSIHDQAGTNGGLPFSTANNTVYYQSVGDYRDTPAGTKVTFTDSAIAATSLKYGQIFQTQRSAAEGHSVRLQGNTGYDLGSRGLPAGNIWIVQLLSKVPWIYNEAGGNSSGMSGLSPTDEQKYANGLVAGIEACVPV
jgi:N-acetylmuramoyl-L-alanine amidase